jgi:hypothetical protein
VDQKDQPAYPLLEALLRIKGLTLQATYTNADVASLFDVSVRTIQDRVTSDQLNSRDLPGHKKFFPIDLEDFFRNSKKKKKGGK